MLLLCACAALEARGDLVRLDPTIRQALDGGVTVNENDNDNDNCLSK